ncbi:MAG TPA: cytochrome c [Candidatus Binatia bacterium]|nr:cytochrome c [Candidatus Binatia bacterium]
MPVFWRKTRIWWIAILLVIVAAMVTAFRLRRTGLSTRTSPGPFERFASKQIRAWLIPATARNTTNSLPANAEILTQGMDHWADHCATCHANNGSGDTEMGRNFYPPAPDMRMAETQSLSDGQLYYIIRNGVPLTGMPAWGDPSLGNSDSQTWALVSFIRHLPTLTPDEITAMEKLNPKTAGEREEEQAEEDFLNGQSDTKSESRTRRKQ